MPEFIELDGALENVELFCTKIDGTKYDFNRFSLPLKFIAKIRNYEITLDETIKDQTKLEILINKLNEYNPRNSKKVKEKERVLESAKTLSDARDEIINLFEKGIFPYEGNLFKTKEKEESDEELDENKFFKDIEKESKDINYELLEKYFKYSAPTALAKELFRTKNKNKNNDLVNSIMVKWSILKDEFEKMSEDEKEIEQPDKVLKMVKEIIEFNKKNSVRTRLKNINTKPNA